MSKTILIFSGFNRRAIVSFCRVLTKNKLSFAIIANSVKDPILQTDYAKMVLSVRKNQHLDMDDIISSIVVCEKKLGQKQDFIIAPSSEALNRFLLTNKHRFQKQFSIKIPLVGEQMYLTISDKKSFGDLCHKNNLRVPVEFDFGNVKNFPVVAKPKKYRSVRGISLYPVIIEDVNQLNQFTSKYFSDDFYFQEFIAGESYYLLYYFSKTGRVAKYSQKNLVQQSGGKSILAAISSDLHHTEISAKYEIFFKGLGFTGFVMIELKYFNHKYYMIEANPRFWGPSQLFVDGNSNLFELFLFDYGFEVEFHKEQKKQVKYFWFGGMIQELQKKNKVVFHQFSEQEFNNDLHLWLNHDVYNHPDTANVFLNEIINE